MEWKVTGARFSEGYLGSQGTRAQIWTLTASPKGKGFRLKDFDPGDTGGHFYLRAMPQYYLMTREGLAEALRLFHRAPGA